MGPSPGSGESALGIEENPRRDVEAGAKRESQHGRAPASASGAETSTRPSAITHLVTIPRPIQDFIWACDFFTVTTARLRTFYVLFFMELGRRRLLLFNVTEHPQAEWVVQQVRNLSVQHDHLPRFILHDRDGQFTEEFDACAEGSGAKIIKLPARSPAERWVRSVRGSSTWSIL